MRSDMFKSFLIFLTITGFAVPCLAQSFKCSPNPPVNLGSFSKLDQQPGTYAIDTGGVVTMSGNMKTVAQPSAGAYQCQRVSQGGPGFYITTTPVCTVTTSGCAATGSISMTLGTSSSSFDMSLNAIVNIPYGVNLNIPASCSQGTYTGTCPVNALLVNGNALPGLSPITFTFTVVPYLVISETASLNFGLLGSTTSASTVKVSSAGVRSGTATLLSSSPAAHAAEFHVSGMPNMSFSVSLPASVTLKNAGGATLTVDDLTISTGTLTGLSTGSTGETDFSLGGTLNVPPNAPGGTYSGEYMVTVSY